jgi:cystathionine gamma-synthase
MDKMDQFNVEENSYLEERYARNLPASAAMDAKKTLKRRIAGVLLREGEPETKCHIKEALPASPAVGPSSRGVANISEDDVFLFPGGMCAIWHSHYLLSKTLGSRKSICWG